MGGEALPFSTGRFLPQCILGEIFKRRHKLKDSTQRLDSSISRLCSWLCRRPTIRPSIHLPAVFPLVHCHWNL